MQFRSYPPAAIAFVLVGAVLAPPAAAEQAKAVVKPIAKADHTWTGQPIVFPQRNGQVIASMYEIPPGTQLPVHMHPTLRTAYVLSGTLRVTSVEDGSSHTFQAGEFVVESLGTWHKGENIASEPMRLLVIDVAEKGVEPTVLHK